MKNLDLSLPFNRNAPNGPELLAEASHKGLDAARAYFERRYPLGDAPADLIKLVASLELQAGRPADAVARCEEWAGRSPGNPDAWLSLGWALCATGKRNAGLDALKRARKAGCRDGLLHRLRIATYLRAGHKEHALAAASELVIDAPHQDLALSTMAEIARLAGRTHPDALACRTAGWALIQNGDKAQAIRALERAADLNPDDGKAWTYLAAAHRAAKAYGPAEAAILRAFETGADDHESRNLYGLILQETCQPGEAVAQFNKALAHAPDRPVAAANAAMAMHYIPGLSAQDIRTAIAKCAEIYGEKAASPAQPPAIGSPDRLRVGLFSGAFHRHPTLYLSIAGLEGLDPDRIALVGYANGPRSDDLTERLQACCETWHNVQAWTDAEVFDQIRTDKIDILIDMAGYTQGRPGLIVRRPAPVQIKWVGGLYNTSGLPGMDWLLADSAQIPADHDALYSERVLRMPNGYVVYEAPAYAPDVGPLPLSDAGRTTFSCFNNPSKINAEIVAVWARILKRLPDSRLILKGAGYLADGARERVTGWFAAQDIESSRVMTEGNSPHADLLDRYNATDIALDSWPYSGGLTTCEALWMGNPVISRPGPTFAGRHAMSHLANLGRHEWIAPDWDSYVEMAVALAGNPDVLAGIRAGLRREMTASTLCDGRLFARHLQAALFEIAAASTKS